MHKNENFLKYEGNCAKSLQKSARWIKLAKRKKNATTILQ
jgi:hypothetical protein